MSCSSVQYDNINTSEMFGRSTLSAVLVSTGKSCPKLLHSSNKAQLSSRSSRFEPRTEALKKTIQPWLKDEKKKSFFFEGASMTDIAKFLQTPMNFSRASMIGWLHKRVYDQEVKAQSRGLTTIDIVGRDVAAAYALLPMGVALKYKGKPLFKMDEKKNRFMNVPEEFEEGWILESIDMSGCRIHYEGFASLKRLHSVHTLTAQNSPFLDDWCMDLITSELLGLETADFSGCQSISPRGLATLSRLPNLQRLELHECPAVNTEDGVFVCLCLQDLNPKLSIKGVELLNFKDSTPSTLTEQSS